MSIYGHDKEWHTLKDLQEHLRNNPLMFEQEKKALEMSGRIEVVGNVNQFSITTLTDNVFSDAPFANESYMYGAQQKITTSKSGIDAFRASRMTADQRKRAENTHWLVNGLLPAGYHVILYGAAGSGKTSIALKLSEEIVVSNQDITVIYFYLDGAYSMASHYQNYIENKGLQERLILAANLTAEEMLSNAEIAVKETGRPENLMFIIDTLKYLNPDVINKSSNAKILHRIRENLTQAGATVLTLHHTNKDGANFAGTAEVEQDSDALLRIDTADDPSEEGWKLSTISEGGRCRFNVKPTTFRFQAGMPETAKMQSKSINASEAKQEQKDSKNIAHVKKYLEDGYVPKMELVQMMLKDDSINVGGRDKCSAFIQRYAGKHWQIKLSGERNQIHNIMLLEKVRY